jgi:hypothetical protein
VTPASLDPAFANLALSILSLFYLSELPERGMLRKYSKCFPKKVLKILVVLPKDFGAGNHSLRCKILVCLI